MALDTRYRPLHFSEVIGQDGTVQVLRQFVRSNKGFHQSYVFCGDHGSGKCVAGSTLVTTDRGIFPIEHLMGPHQVDPLEMTVVQEGGVLSKTAYSYRDGLQPTIKITTYLGYQIEGTAKHRIRVLLPSGDVGWVSLGEIQEGVQTCILVGSPVFGEGADLSGFTPEAPSVPEVPFVHMGHDLIPFSPPKTLDEPWARLMGCLVGGAPLIDADVKHLTSSLLQCSRHQVQEFLSFVGVREDRCVPWSIFQSPKNVIASFLQGYLKVSGCIGQDGVEVTSRSERLVREVQHLLLLLGVVSRIQNCGNCWRVSYSASQNEFGMQDALEESYFYDPVVSVDHGEAEVFDLNVPEGGMFAANGFMNHNTTLGRILARALLCENPTDGNPCDQCVSCKSILTTGSAECFVEFDAATNSGKEDIKKIVEAIQYDTFSGKQRIYLIDESHRLSKQALDALLKPMEDTVGETDDKLLICIFCTTEPEKMSNTIFSRCAPAFKIRKVPTDKIAARLAYVCDQEGITYDLEALTLISEVTQSHIRDALKTVEGVSMLGSVNRDNVWSYLHLDANKVYLEILQALGTDLGKVMSLSESLFQMVSPVTCYERLADVSMLAYRVGIGAGKAPSYWDLSSLQNISKLHGAHLVRFALTFSRRPGHPTLSMLLCDLAQLHHDRRGEVIVSAPSRRSPICPPVLDGSSPAEEKCSVKEVSSSGKVADRESCVDAGGVYTERQAIKRRVRGASGSSQNTVSSISPAEFRRILLHRVAELADGDQRR